MCTTRRVQSQIDFCYTYTVHAKSSSNYQKALVAFTHKYKTPILGEKDIYFTMLATLPTHLHNEWELVQPCSQLRLNGRKCLVQERWTDTHYYWQTPHPMPHWPGQGSRRVPAQRSARWIWNSLHRWSCNELSFQISDRWNLSHLIQHRTASLNVCVCVCVCVCGSRRVTLTYVVHASLCQGIWTADKDIPTTKINNNTIIEM